jgi:orotate phosphoribosyltransferase
MMSREALAEKIMKRATLYGEFTLRSGQKSHVYFDKYLFESDTVLLQEIARQMAALVPPQTDALAGLEMGGIPLATMLSLHTGLPTLFVRKKAKEYGTCKLAEGGEVGGRKLVVVEDVITSGGQVIQSSAELRALGAEIDVVLCVIDRESGGRESLAKEKLALRSLFTRSDLEVRSPA